MAVVRNLMVRAGADFSAISTQAKKASSSMEMMSKRINNATSKIKSAFSAIGVGLSIAAIVGAAKDAAQAYDAQAEAEARLAQVMRNTMGARTEDIQSIKDLCSAQQELGVIGDEVQLAGAQELATYLEEKSSLEKLIPVMNDMVAQQYGFNATQESATNIATMLGKVMEGQTGALSRYGYYFDEAQQKILKYGTEAERAATLAEIVENSVGGMNKALAQTPTGRMKQLSNTLGDIKEQFGKAVRTIGTAFLPVLNTVAKILADVATLANKVAQAIANVFGGRSNNNTYTYAAPQAADAVGDVADSYNDMAKKAQKAEKAQKAALSVLDIDTLHFLNKKNDNTSSGSGDDDADETPSSSGGNPMSGIAESAGEATESAGMLENILQKLKDLWNELDFGPLKKAWEGLKDALDPLIDKIKNGLGWCWENVLKPLAHWTIEKAAPAAVDLLTAAFNALNAILDALKPAFDWLWEKVLKPLAEWTGDLFIFALKEITDLLNDFADLINGKISLRQFISDLDLFQKALVGVSLALAEIKIASWVSTGIKAIEKLILKVIALKESITGASAAANALALPAANMTTGAKGAAYAMADATGAAERWAYANSSLASATKGVSDATSGFFNKVGTFSTAMLVPTITLFNDLTDELHDYDTVIYSSSSSTEQLGAVVSELNQKYQEESKRLENMTWWQRMLSDQSTITYDTRQKLIEASSAYEAACKREGKAIEANVSVAHEMDGLFSGLKDRAINVAESIASAFVSLHSKLKSNVYEPIKSNFKNLLEDAKIFVSDAEKRIRGAFEDLSSWFTNKVFDPIKANFTDLCNKMKVWASDSAEKAKNAWGNFTSSVRSKFDEVRSSASSIVENIKTKWSELPGKLQSLGASASEKFSSALETVVSKVKAIVDKIKSLVADIGSAISSAKSTVSSTVESMQNSISSAFNSVKNSVSGVIGSIGSSISIGLGSFNLPFLAEGAVIPPNTEFAAILGDQTHGYNIETPEDLLRQIFREETGAGNDEILSVAKDILRAVKAGKIIAVDGTELGRTARSALADQSRAFG